MNTTWNNLLKYVIPRQFQTCHEPISPQLIKELINKPDPIIVEIGANDGTHTAWFLEIFDNPRIYCFEPEPRAIERFKRNIDDNPKVTLFEYALADRNGEMEFYQSSGFMGDHRDQLMPGGWDYSGSIRKPKLHLEIHPKIKFETSIMVPVRTLDSCCDEINIRSIDFLWMDVQGAEIDVFRGARNVLPHVHHIYTEYSNVEIYEGQAGLKELLKELKTFKVDKKYPDDVLLVNSRFL